MPLNPPPIISAGLALLEQPLLRSDMSRAAMVTFAINVTGTPSVALAQTTVNDFQTAFNTYLGPNFDSEVSLLQPTVRLGALSTVPFEAVATGAVVTGGTSGNFVPPNVACLVKKTTGLGGRENRGRMYLPFFLPQGAVNENGTILSGSLASVQTAVHNFFFALSATPYTPCLAHRVYNTPHPPHYVTEITTGSSVTAMTAEPIIATQRRRLGR